MAITNAIIQVRRGNEADFDPDKMHPGEWAVSTDTRYVRICFTPGVCVRMATYDAFEVDMAKIEKIFEECQTIEDAVKLIQEEINAKEIVIEQYVQEAKAYSEIALSEADRATLEADRAKEEADRAENIANVGIATTDKAGLVKPDGETIRVDPDGTIHADNGTVDYNELENKPKINGVELRGSKSLSELGIASADDLEETNSKVNIIIEKAELNIKNSAKGENIHLTDSADSKAVSFSLYGKAEQKQYSGKNLLENTATTQTVNGVTFTVNENGSVTVDGTATDTTRLIIVDNYLFQQGSYILNGCTSGGSESSFRLEIYKSDFSSTIALDYGNGASFTLDEETTVRVSIRIGSGYTINNLIFYPMISIEGGEYEPYVGGMPSPNPDYPQDITVSGESYNLLENTATPQEINGVSFVVNEDKSVTANGTSSAETAKKIAEHPLEDGTYILSGRYSNSCFVRVLGYTTSSSWKTIVQTSTADNTLFTMDNSVYSKVLVQAIVLNGTTLSDATIYPMIRKATVKNDRYMPYGVGSVEVVSCGKNRINYKEIASTWYKPSTSSVYRKVFTLKPNTQYTLSCDVVSSLGAFCFVVSGDNLNFSPSTANNGAYYSRSVITDSNGKLTVGTYNEVDGVNVADINIQLEEGTRTEYEPHKGTVSTIPTPNGLAGIKVSSGGNYTDENGQQWICDEIVKYADGSGKRIQRIASVDMGTLTWGYETPYFKAHNLIGVVKEPESYSTFSNIISTCFIAKGYEYLSKNDNAITVVHSESTSHGQIWCKASDYTDVAPFLEMVSGQYLYYELATPITTDLTAEEVAEIEKLHTFYPVTNISNDADCGMSISYMADAKNYIDNRLALIESALINNI